mgnify:CR=1 FL=1
MRPGGQLQAVVYVHATPRVMRTSPHRTAPHRTCRAVPPTSCRRCTATRRRATGRTTTAPFCTRATATSTRWGKRLGFAFQDWCHASHLPMHGCWHARAGCLLQFLPPARFLPLNGKRKAGMPSPSLCAESLCFHRLPAPAPAACFSSHARAYMPTHPHHPHLCTHTSPHLYAPTAPPDPPDGGARVRGQHPGADGHAHHPLLGGQEQRHGGGLPGGGSGRGRGVGGWGSCPRKTE